MPIIYPNGTDTTNESCDQHKILFLHIPKTGGTTIEHVCKELGMCRLDRDYLYTHWSVFEKNSRSKHIRCSLQHLTFQEIESVCPSVLEDTTSVMTLFRDPIGRLQSEFSYMKYSLWKDKKSCLLWGVDFSWAQSVLRDLNTFIPVMYGMYRNNPSFMDNHFVPQACFLDGLEDHRLGKFTKMYHFSQLCDGTLWSHLVSDLSFPQSLLDCEKPHKNSFQKKSHSPHQLTDLSRQLVSEWYHRDFHICDILTQQVRDRYT